jgi:O-antigen ligase
MELVLIKALALLRPVFDMDTAIKFAGISVLELAGILFSSFLAVGLFIVVATRKDTRFSLIDLLILGFTGWCLAVSLIYFNNSDMKEVAKFTVPLITYTVAKIAITNEKQYRDTILLMVIGLSIPAVLSAIQIMRGEGLYLINYWTGVPRYKGMYEGPHNMSHDMAFLIMLMGIYLLVREPLAETGQIKRSSARNVMLLCLAGVAFFCIYMSSVRTTLVGLFVFGAIIVSTYYKKGRLVLVATVAILLLFGLDESVQQRYFREAAQAERDPTFTEAEYGSGRLRIWSEYFENFLAMPVDRQLAGVGIGNWHNKGDWPVYLDAHNDFINILVFTGYVGFVLFIALQVAILRKILTISSREKYVFFALFVAVTAMNLVSNSYVTRFGLAQMYYLTLAYIELPRRRERDVTPIAPLATLAR